MIRLLIAGVFLSCRNSKDIQETGIEQDGDGDGYYGLDDCDDSNPDVYPDNEEICDGIDNNCNDQIDEEVLLTFYLDQDSDGFGIESDTVEGCEPPEGYVEFSGDCDDDDPITYPEAPEQCDGIDNDCSDETEIDEGVIPRWYLDEDGDGFGDPDSYVDDCNPGEGFVDNDEDCDDLYSNVYPGS